MQSTNDLRAQILLQEAAELLRLGRSAQAVRKARTAAQLIADPVVRAINLAGVLIDAGAELKKVSHIKEGVGYLKAIEGKITEQTYATFHYNIGNGFSYLGGREQGIGAGTRPSLALAESHLAAAVEKDPRSDVRANFAGVLLAQGRWIEAYDEFAQVIEEDPTHHSSFARRASSLIGIYNWTARHTGLLAAALADYEVAIDLAQDEPVFQNSYRSTANELKARGVAKLDLETTEPTREQRWIWNNRLALNPCPLCQIDSPGAFDLYPLAYRLAGGARRPPIDDLHDMVNAICQGYAVARWILYRAMSSAPRQTDHVITVPGSPGARHNLRVGLLMSAVTGFYAVLGKVGYALNAYYGLGHPQEKVNFRSIWRPPGVGARSVPLRRADLHTKLVRAPTPALSALHRVAVSLEHGLGRYESLRTLRNEIEHHLVIASQDSRESPYYRAVRIQELREDAVRIGRVAKSCVWYLGGALLRGEQERLKRARRRGAVVSSAVGHSVKRA